ncbi:hypothetical protein B0H10DRAFT_1962411 [Mycena sp. CBHHK59/15]|nr:hypothetical protein B0H10DRAFT_1962411 [Mycena sp. CBHHK59/15]
MLPATAGEFPAVHPEAEATAAHSEVAAVHFLGHGHYQGPRAVAHVLHVQCGLVVLVGHAHVIRIGVHRVISYGVLSPAGSEGCKDDGDGLGVEGEGEGWKYCTGGGAGKGGALVLVITINYSTRLF